ncbi:MAG: hypothetical protein ACRYGG_23290, partial [Janthinobacterium lividum]
MSNPATLTDLINIQLDAQTLASVANSTASTVTSRLGVTYPTLFSVLQGILAKNLTVQFKSTYSASTTYNVGDTVQYLGSLYICAASSTGNLPTDTTHWALAVAKGDSGQVSTKALGTSLGSVANDLYTFFNYSNTRNRYNTANTVIGGISSTTGLITPNNPSYFKSSGPIDISDLTSWSSNIAIGNGSGNDATYSILDGSGNLLVWVSNGQPTGTVYPNVDGGVWLYIEHNVNAAPSAGGPIWVGAGATPTGIAPAFGYTYPDASYVNTLKTALPNPATVATQAIVASIETQDSTAAIIRNVFNPGLFKLGFTFNIDCYNNPSYATTANGGPYNGCVTPYEQQSTDQSVGSIYIPVVKGKSYQVVGGNPNNSNSTGLIFYGPDGVPDITTFHQLPIPANYIATAKVTGYMRVTLRSADVPTMMILTGTSTAYTGAYIPFVQAPSTTQTRSPWNGKKVAFFGDSYTQGYGSDWQPQFLAYHGLVDVFQDARSGRPIGNDALSGEGLFEGYANDPINGKFDPTYQPHQGAFGTCGQASPLSVAGNTLKQNLALFNPDLMIVALGTNTYSTNVTGTVT